MFFGVIEGGNGSGKSSVIDLMAKKNDNIYKTFEPTTGDHGKSAIDLVRKGEPDAALYYFNMDRAKHLKNVIYPNMQNGKIVLCDRYVYSTWVYQCPGDTLDQWRKNLEEFIIQQPRFLMPHATIMLLVSKEEASRRMSYRGDPFNSEMFDWEHQKYLELVKMGYGFGIQTDGRSIEDVAEQCARFFMYRVGGRF